MGSLQVVSFPVNEVPQIFASVEQGCFAPWPKAMRSKPVKWLCLPKINVRTIKSLQIQSSVYFRLCWNSFQGVLLVSRICYSVVRKDPTKETQVPKVLKPFLGQDEIRSVAPKALTHLMRDPRGIFVLWPLILMPSCLLNKSIVSSSKSKLTFWITVIEQLKLTSCHASTVTSEPRWLHRCPPQLWPWASVDGKICLCSSALQIAWAALLECFSIWEIEICLIRCSYAYFETFWNSTCTAANPALVTALTCQSVRFLH